MANKITCTCGHSWNKSDSSKKDMNVCHICGKDNTMKDGGWLDKYEQGGMVLKQKTHDNYGKKPNANYPEVTLPPGFVGQGYNIKGRNYSPAWGGQFQNGGQASADSVRHQANKILQYEQLRGGPGGAPLPYYSDPKYMNMLMGNIYPEVKKILPNASAMEAGEAMDFIFNAGWDQANSKILKDPRAYALQEYYKQYDPSKLDAEGKWSGRKNAAYSFDQEYNTTIGKLPENERRILMNKGRDWYYRNINNPAPGVPSSNYYDTWYGRIWNTNDYQPFNPNNPKFIPKKQTGGVLQPPMAGANQTVPMAQTGTRQPIYTSDLQDPRLRAYNDSLSMYKNTLNLDRMMYNNPIMTASEVERIPTNPDVVYKNPVLSWNEGEAYLDGKTKNYKEIEKQKIKPIGYKSIQDATDYKRVSYPVYKKPVQPVEYRKRILEKPSLSVDLPNIELTDVRPAIAQSAFEQARVDMSKPTKYSFTYPTFDQDVQKTMYFPDRNSWKTFVEQQRGASSQEGKDYGSATGQFAMGGSLPGAVGFTYARVSGAAPANGPYAKKTKASAQNGQEMSFYQHGLDWKPKNISRNGNWLDKFEEGGEIVKDNEGYWNPENWGKPVEIGSNEITMEGVLEPLLGVSDTGDTQMMYPGKNYTFNGKSVVEYPREYFQELGVAKDGKSVNRADEYPLEKLDNLLNFTNYNKPQKAKSGKWLDKYQ
jgi:hypothetical protein